MNARLFALALLLLASAGTPGFLQVAPVATDHLVLDALERWAHVPRHWRLGEVTEATVTGDADRLVAALDALLENAVAHTEPGDRIEVSVHRDDGHAVIAVTDSGCGIPPSDLERIFGRFARAEPYRSRQAGGFGLGLPIVQAITEAHHGSVRVHSASGRGAAFEMVLPTDPTPGPPPRLDRRAVARGQPVPARCQTRTAGAASDVDVQGCLVDAGHGVADRDAQPPGQRAGPGQQRVGLAQGGTAVRQQGPVEHGGEQLRRLPVVAEGRAAFGLVAAGGEDHRMAGVDPGGRQIGDSAEALSGALSVA